MNNNSAPILRWEQRFYNLERAYAVLCRIIERLQNNQHDEVVQMAAVQAFEFTFELAWKTMKDYLESEGFVNVASPKQVIRTAFQATLIDNAEAWLEMANKRNIVSHTYNDIVLEESADFIITVFYPLIKTFMDTMKARI